MSRILCTGAAGFISSWIVKELVSQGHEVYGVDDLSGGNLRNIREIVNHKNFHFTGYGCEDEKAMDELFDAFRPDVVYHLAANAREGASFFQPLSIVKRNTLAYTNVLMNSIKYGVKRIVLFSSIAVMGNQTPPFAEHMPRKPIDLYGLQKANMEQMTEMMAECHGIEYVIFRPHNVFGEGQALNDRYRNAIAIFMNRIMREEPIQIYGDGRQQRAFSYIEDSLPSYIRAMDCPTGHIFNIGNDFPRTVNEIARYTMEAMGVDFKTYPVENLPDRHGEVKSAYMSHQKAKEMLGFDRHTYVMDGLLKMASWAKQQGPQEWREGDPIELPDSKLLPKNWRK